LVLGLIAGHPADREKGCRGLVEQRFPRLGIGLRPGVLEQDHAQFDRGRDDVRLGNQFLLGPGDRDVTLQLTLKILVQDVPTILLAGIAVEVVVEVGHALFLELVNDPLLGGPVERPELCLGEAEPLEPVLGVGAEQGERLVEAIGARVDEPQDPRPFELAEPRAERGQDFLATFQLALRLVVDRQPRGPVDVRRVGGDDLFQQFVADPGLRLILWGKRRDRIENRPGARGSFMAVSFARATPLS